MLLSNYFKLMERILKNALSSSDYSVYPKAKGTGGEDINFLQVDGSSPTLASMSPFTGSNIKMQCVMDYSSSSTTETVTFDDYKFNGNSPYTVDATQFTISHGIDENGCYMLLTSTFTNSTNNENKIYAVGLVKTRFGSNYYDVMVLKEATNIIIPANSTKDVVVKVYI